MVLKKNPAALKNILVICAEFDHFCDSLYVYSPLAPVYLESCPNIHYVLAAHREQDDLQVSNTDVTERCYSTASLCDFF